jgi:hypothetical protein
MFLTIHYWGKGLTNKMTQEYVRGTILNLREGEQ